MTTAHRLLNRGVLVLGVATFLFLAAIVVLPAYGQTENVLYSFCSQPNCSDGAVPYGGVIIDKGNLYGTTYYGGETGNGTVFKVTPKGEETVLYSFQYPPDGNYPYAALIMDKEGNFYGTTVGGGAHNNGTVFKLTAKGVESVLYSFCAQPSCGDGAQPYGGLIMDKEDNLYGTTPYGGANGAGTVFKISSSGEESVLYSFQGAPDGVNPFSTLIMDKKGNLYGTTAWGGAYCPSNGCGTVFKLSATGEETVLYSFQSLPDAANPFAGVIMDTKDNLYGTTVNGGQDRSGAVFELTSKGEESVLYSFTGGGDGIWPYAGLVRSKAGTLYGVTIEGNGNNYGAAFELSPGEPWNFTVLHDFNGGDGDGLAPYGTLILSKEGNLYGTTAGGGACSNCDGAVFEIVP